MSYNDTSTYGYLRWFIGFVVDVIDPLKLGRVKVRIPNSHDGIEDENLPWASPLNPIQSASYLGVGISPLGLLPGSMVFGFFISGNEGSMPIVAGSIPKITNNDFSKHDVPDLAREINSITKEDIEESPEPKSPYNAKYPYNRVMKTLSGHVVEFDDTPGEERIHLFHRSGTYIEIDSQGNHVIKTTGNLYNIVNKDEKTFIFGNADVTIKNNCKVIIEGNYDLHVKGDINIKSEKNIKLNADRIDLN